MISKIDSSASKMHVLGPQAIPYPALQASQDPILDVPDGLLEANVLLHGITFVTLLGLGELEDSGAVNVLTFALYFIFCINLIRFNLK